MIACNNLVKCISIINNSNKKINNYFFIFKVNTTSITTTTKYSYNIYFFVLFYIFR